MWEGFFVEIGTAGALIGAGMIKLARPGDIRRAINALGISPAPSVAFLLAVTEVASGLALVLAPGTWYTSVAVGGLGLAFASAGAFAIARKLHVSCACFGTTGSGQLGVRQILLLPLWAGVAIVTKLDNAPQLADKRADLLLGVTLTLSAALVVRTAFLFKEHRTLRHLAEGR
jgi:hypothetical protein